jgi:hypothetical protein
MGKILVFVGIAAALYLFAESQAPGSRHRLGSLSGLGAPALKATPGGSIGAAAVGVAGRVGN